MALLAAFLLGIQSAEQVARDPLRGNLYENLMILEVLKAHLNRGLRPDLYFYRDSQGNEVDLLIRQRNGLLPVAVVLYNGEQTHQVKQARVFNLLRSEQGADFLG